MIVYLLAGAFAVGLLGGAGGMNWWDKAATARAELAQKEAEAQVQQQAQEALVEADNKIIDMNASFEAGMAKGRANVPRLTVRTRSDVTSTAAFQTAPCVMPAASFMLYKSALSTLHKGDIADDMLIVRPSSAPVEPPGAAVSPAPKVTQPSATPPPARVVTNPLRPK